jgi:hypothetical protein
MRRREFMARLSGALAGPLAAVGDQLLVESAPKVVVSALQSIESGH